MGAGYHGGFGKTAGNSVDKQHPVYKKRRSRFSMIKAM